MHTDLGIHADTSRASAGHTARRPRAALLLLLAAVLGLAAGSAARPQDARAAHISGTPFVLTDRTVKLRLLKQLARPPRLLILGGSRATRIEPSYFQRLTGLPGFNLAFQNGRPEDAWAFVNYLHLRYPQTPLQVVWFLHVEAFREQGLSAGLVEEPDLSCWFPASLIATARSKLPRTQAEVPECKDIALTTFGSDGVVLRNRYDIAMQNGRTLSSALSYSIRTALKRYATTSPALYPRSQRYFERTVDLLNQMGTLQVVVLSPLQPRLLAAVRNAGWNERHREVMDYLTAMQSRFGFCLLDCSELSSIGGDPDDFYDGFHMMQDNSRRLVDTVVAKFPKAFDAGSTAGD